YVTTAPGTSSGVAPIFVDEQSQNRILIIKGANQQLSAADIDAAAEALKACQLIILQLEIPLETVYYAIDFARQHGIKVILNPAPAVENLDIAYACKCDFFMPNETEL
ncbi:PfkB family carbohydrate kinase, partial [Chromobacterium piscinae]